MLAVASEPPARVPLHWLWHEKQTDSAYTISADRRDRLIRERGYVDMGVIGYVHAQPAPHARPLKCFYAPAPRTDSFCSISELEQHVVRKLGYEEVGTEGYVLNERREGSVVLFRVARAYGDGKDFEHRFVISDSELVHLRKLGWTYDGAKGFIYPSP